MQCFRIYAPRMRQYVYSQMLKESVMNPSTRILTESIRYNVGYWRIWPKASKIEDNWVEDTIVKFYWIPLNVWCCMKHMHKIPLSKDIYRHGHVIDPYLTAKSMNLCNSIWGPVKACNCNNRSVSSYFFLQYFGELCRKSYG